MNWIKKLFCKHNYVKRKTEYRKTKSHPNFTSSCQWDIYETSVCTTCGKTRVVYTGSK